MTADYRRKRPTQSDAMSNIVTALGRAVWALLSLPFRTRQPKRQLNQQVYRQYWQTVVELIGHENSPQYWHQAIMDADKLVDQAMREKGIIGTTFGERLKVAEERLSNPTYQGLWEAHKLRNQLAHEVGARLNQSSARLALQQFERGLKEFGAL